MQFSALADALTDFGSKRKESVPARAEAPAPVSRMEIIPVPSVPEADVAARIAIEVARAQAELSGQLARSHSEALENERAAHAEAIAELTRRQGEELGKLVADRFEAVGSRLIEVTTAAVARILAAALTEEMRKRALDALAAALRSALDDESMLRIRTSGPRALYEPLADAMGDLAARLNYRETDAFDLTVEFDDRIIETRLAEWREALAQVTP